MDEVMRLRRLVSAIDHDRQRGWPDYEYEIAPDHWVRASEWRKIAVKRLAELSKVTTQAEVEQQGTTH